MGNVQVIKDGAEVAFLACKESEVLSPRGGKKGSGYAPLSCAFSPDGQYVAVGSDETIIGHQQAHSVHRIFIYKFGGSSLELHKTLEKHHGPVTSLAYSPDGKYLASADALNQIFVWDAASLECKISTWSFHTSSVQRISWHANSKHLVSGGLDSNAIVWNVDADTKKVIVKRAHPLGVKDCCFVDE